MNQQSGNVVHITVQANAQSANQTINQTAQAIRSLNQAANAGGQTANVTRQMQGLHTVLRQIRDLGRLYWLTEFFETMASGVRHIVRTASELELLRRSLVMWSDSVEQANKRYKDLIELGKKGFGARATVGAGVGLQAVGLQPTMGQIEGLQGYLALTGKTDEYAFTNMIDRITALIHIGNVGVEDALKEFTQVVPFAMAALRESLGKSYFELMQDFRKRNVDFSTIIKSSLDYAEKYFKDGLNQMADTVKFSYRRLVSTLEALGATLESSGALRPFVSLMDDMRGELDRLVATGKFEEWFKRLARAVEEFMRSFGNKGLLESAGNALVGFLERALAVAEKLKGPIEVLVGLFDKLMSVIDVLEKVVGKEGLTALLTTGAAYRIGGPVVGGATAGWMGMDWVMGKMKDAFGWLDRKIEEADPLAAWRRRTGNMDPNVRAVPGGFTAESGPTKELFDRYMKILDRSEKYRISPEQQHRLKIEFEGTGGQATPGEAGSKIANAIRSGLFDQGQLGIANQIMNIDTRMKTFTDRFVQGSLTAGKTGMERLRADLDAQLSEWQAYMDEREKLIKKFRESVVGNKSGEALADEMEAAAKVEKESVAEAVGRYLEQEQKYWDDKAADKAESLSNSLLAFQDKVKDVQARYAELEGTLRVELLRDKGQEMDAIRMELKQRAAKDIADVENSVRELEESRRAIDNAINRESLPVKLDQPLLDEMSTGLQQAQESKDRLVQMIRQHYENLAKPLQEAEIERTSVVADLERQYAELTGTVYQQLSAEQELAKIEHDRLILQYQGNEEAQRLVDKLYEEKALRLEMEKSGNFLSGFKLAYRDAMNSMPTAAQYGKNAFEVLTQSIDSASNALVSFITTGKIGFTEFAQSVIVQIMQMITKFLLMKVVMSFLGPLFGGSSGGFMSAGGAFWTSGMNFLEHHSGGVVGSSGRPRMLPSYLLNFAPRLHSGLAADEFPAILQRGEVVLPKGAQQQGFVMDSKIEVNVSPMVTGTDDPAKLRNMAGEIGRAVRAEVQQQIQASMRDGGVLSSRMRVR